MATKVKLLEKNLGGKWHYDGICSWYCDDDQRRVVRCCVVDIFGELSGPSQYWLYGDGRPQRAEKFMRGKPVVLELPL